MGFCERLTALLKEKKIDKNDFLSDCGLGRNSFSNWKSSKKGYPTAPVLKVISDYLGVSVEYLMGETDERGQKKSPGQVTEAELDEELIQIWNSADDVEREAIVNAAKMVRSLRGK
nr:MAG TPA: bifunctional HTH-domain containing protein/aminotransferase [Caudoviricetes sp.]